MADDDILHLIEDTDEQPTGESGPRWKVAVIDDDPAVHDGTRFALADYRLHGQGLEILSAHSAADGRELMRRHSDIAVVLLDVIMETDDAGLKLVDFIRNELKNETVRIILRTGQPGQAPERRVIVDYDINDYKAKTELTADKLFTSLTAALRSYQQLRRMVQTRRGLEIIVDAASALYDFKSIQKLAEGVLTQLASLLDVACAGILVMRESRGPPERFSVLAGSGSYSRFAGVGDAGALDPELRRLVEEAFERRRHVFLERWSVLYIETGSGGEVLVLLDAARPLSDTDRTLVEIFSSRLSTAFDNVILYEQLQEANAQLEQRVAQRTRDLMAANRQLAEQGTRLERANAFKTEVLGTVAHDLKNPLAVIVGRTDLLMKMVDSGPFFAERVATQIEHIRAAASRLTDMVNSLLSDAMSDALDITVRRENVDLAQVIKDVAEANQPLAANKQQFIAVTAPASHPALCDSARIREAIDNLLSNAIKYSPIGGRIELMLERQGKNTVIRVRDHGAGLSAVDLSRLFGRFQRLSARPTGGESSTGLGLSIVKRIVELHGGTISAESPGPGQGTTFTLTLPAE
jgi:signal transduction histidine kinase/DNA-binding NarL/FixJ family response regulator